APTFAGELMMRLSGTPQFGVRELTIVNVKLRAWWVSGLLPLKAHEGNGATSSSITIVVEPDWLERPPTVTAHDSFIRREIDWHAYPDGSLCYVLKDEWRDRLGKFMTYNKEDISRAMDYAATWLLAATDSLVTRHLFGSRHGIKQWPPDWLAYAHGDEGVKEYRREQQRAGNNTQ